MASRPSARGERSDRHRRHPSLAGLEIRLIVRAKSSLSVAKMKMRRPHEVPLSRQVIEILRLMIEPAHGSGFVFPAYHNPKIAISENAINQALRRMGYGGVMPAHGFRSTASSLFNESNMWNPDAIERALAHQDGNAVRAVYNRSAYWRDRVEMMQWWSDQLDGLKAAT